MEQLMPRTLLAIDRVRTLSRSKKAISLHEFLIEVMQDFQKPKERPVKLQRGKLDSLMMEVLMFEIVTAWHFRIKRVGTEVKYPPMELFQDFQRSIDTVMIRFQQEVMIQAQVF